MPSRFRPMVILHVVAPAEFGGLEEVVRALAGGLRERGHDAHVAAIVDARTGEHAFCRALTARGVPVHQVVVPPRAYLKERRAIAELCARLRPDVVHTHGYRPDVVDAGVARRLRLPVVTTLHGYTGGGWRNRFYQRLQRGRLRRFDAVVAVSRPLAEAARRSGVPSDRIHLVRNAWGGGAFLDRAAARAALRVPAEGFRVGWVGRLSREKGPDVALEAMTYLRDLPVALSVVGAGRELAGLRALAASRGVTDRVAWHGSVPEAGSLLRAFDVVVLSSRTEGTPIVLLEAMAAGIPVVASRVGGLPDVLSSDEALLVPPEDPAACAAALRAVYADGAGAERRARAAGARLESEFGCSAWVSCYEALYRKLRRS